MNDEAFRPIGGSAPGLTRLWIGSAVFVLYGSLLPFDFRWSLSHAWARAAVAAPLSVPDLVQNALLLVPFGFSGVLALRRRSASVHWSLAIVMATGLALSVLSESLQLFTADRIASPTDVLAQFGGTCAGAFAALAEDRLWTRWIGSGRGPHGGNPWSYPLSVAAAVVVIAAWEPFDAGLDIGTTWAKVKALGADPWQLAAPGDELLQLLRYAAFVFIASAWLECRHFRRPVLVAMLAGIGTGVLLEASELFLDSRMPGCWDASVNACGAVAGGFAAAISPPRVIADRQARAAGVLRTWEPLVIASSAVGGAWQMLAATGAGGVERRIAWLPFRVLIASPPTQVVSHYLQLALIYMPIGIALSASASRSRGSVLVFGGAAAGLMQMCIGLLQQRVAGRYPDATDVLVAVAAGLAGCWVDIVHRRWDIDIIEPVRHGD